jgi:hypothetical protein
VKHAGELRQYLEHGLETTPTAPWRGNGLNKMPCLSIYVSEWDRNSLFLCVMYLKMLENIHATS